MIQLKVLGDGLNLWHKRPGAYWIKVPYESTQRIVPIFEKVTPLARQEQSRSLEELRERAWSLPWPIVEAAALVENKVAVIFVVFLSLSLSLLPWPIRLADSQWETTSTLSWNAISGKTASAGRLWHWVVWWRSFLPPLWSPTVQPSLGNTCCTLASLAVKFQDLLVDIHWQPVGSKEPPCLLGSCFLLPDTFKHSLGKIEIPVTSPK